MVIGRPLAPDDIVDSTIRIFRDRLRIGCCYGSKERCPVARESPKAPVIIAKPIKSLGAGLARDIFNGVSLNLFGIQAAEQQVGSRPLDSADEVSVHAVPA